MIDCGGLVPYTIIVKQQLHFHSSVPANNATLLKSSGVDKYGLQGEEFVGTPGLPDPFDPKEVYSYIHIYLHRNVRFKQLGIGSEHLLIRTQLLIQKYIIT